MDESALYTPPNWLDPMRWQDVFPRPGPIEVELGCGVGSFLLWAAGKWPATNFLGVERLLGRVRKVDGKIRRCGVTNVRLLRIEASYLVTYLVPVASVAAYHIYFPDPWPKRRHHRRRLFSEAFVMRLHATLNSGGAFNCATDDEDYYTALRRAIEQTERWTEEKPLEIPVAGWTDFEKTFRAQGKPIYRCRWRKLTD